MTTDRFKTVVRCVCHRRTFEEIRDMMQAHGLTTFEEVRAKDWCGNGCQMCHPYVKKMIKTGEIAFRPGDVDFE
jgi:NAD(P)H-nitrite reductase large subunit